MSNVEVGRVAAGAAGVDEMASSANLDGVASIAHHLRGAAISPIVSFFTRSPTMKPAICAGESPAHDLAHDVQHLVVEHSRCSTVRWMASAIVICFMAHFSYGLPG